MHARVAFLPFIHIQLKCPKPNDYPETPKAIGEHIRKRRLELGLTQGQAADRLRVSSATVLNWEKSITQPLIVNLGSAISFLGYYPFPQPTTLGERLHRIRCERGWSMKAAALDLGVDPTTWRDWEAGELILFRKHRLKVAQLLGIDELLLADEMRARWDGKHRRGKSKRWQLTSRIAVDKSPRG